MKMNRRKFLFTLGGGTASIAGWLLIPGFTILPSGKDPENVDFFPRLMRDVQIRRTRGGAQLMRQDEHDVLHVVCRVNKSGLNVIENLNGRRTIQDIAKGIYKGSDASQIGRTEASVASFLALLAQAGLLSEPFFVNLQAVEFTV